MDSASRRAENKIDRSKMNKEQDQEVLDAYWKRNVRLLTILLSIWFVVGYVLAIILAPTLNNITFLGGPLGFWIAQNGAIYIFWFLILAYAILMNRLDDEFDVKE